MGLVDDDLVIRLQGIFNFLRGLWHIFPTILYGSDQMPPVGNIGVAVSGLFAFLTYTIGTLTVRACLSSLISSHQASHEVNQINNFCAGSGLGNPKNQSRGLLFFYGIISATNAALVSRPIYLPATCLYRHLMHIVQDCKHNNELTFGMLLMSMRHWRRQCPSSCACLLACQILLDVKL